MLIQSIALASLTGALDNDVPIMDSETKVHVEKVDVSSLLSKAMQLR